MPFGLTSASKIFQKKNEFDFEGIEGVHVMADDIIIAATTVDEYDVILHNVLNRAREHKSQIQLGQASTQGEYCQIFGNHHQQRRNQARP